MSDDLKELISKADRGESEAQRELMERGDAASAAGDINRRFYYMVRQREDYTELMHDIDFRVVLDPICNEVLSGLEEAIYEQV